MANFEDELLDNYFPELKDEEGADLNSTDNTGEDNDPNPSPAPASSQPASEPASNANESNNAAPAPTGTNQQTPSGSPAAPQPGQQGDDTRPVSTNSAGILYSAQGHIVDQQGNILAHAGKERRLYEKTIRDTQDLQTTRSELEQYQQAWNEVVPVVRMVHDAQINPDELSRAIDMFKQFRDNPMDTAKFLLAQLQQMGYDPSEGGTQQLTAAGVQQMVQNALRNANQGNQNIPQPPSANANQDPQVALQSELNRLYSQYPDASMHEAELRQLMTQFKLDAPRAYIELFKWANAKQLDWNLPLTAQLQNPQRGASPNQPGNGAANPNPTRPIPNGHASAPNQQLGEPNLEIAPADTSWDKMIREEMRRNGYKV